MIAAARTDAPRMESATRADRLPPQNLDAETGLIGSVALDNSVWDEVALIVNESHFYRDSHRLIWSAIKSLHAAGSPFDALTIADALESRGELEDAGGHDYIGEILDSVPHAAHAKYYAGIVREKATRRAVITAATEMLREAYGESVPIDDVIADGERALRSMTEAAANNASVPIRAAVVELVERITTPQPRGVATGFWELDKMLAGGGFIPGQSVIIAAGTGMGKSALAGNIAANFAQSGTPVLFVSLEMSTTEVALRLVQRESRFSDQQILGGKLEEYELHSVMGGAETVANLPLYLDCRGGRKMSEVVALSRLHRAKHKVGLVVIDYLQIIEPDDRRVQREQQIAGISRDLKRLAGSLSIPILTLAQINRGVDNREDKTPRLSDLRESGAIANDADTVLFLDRPNKWDSDAPADEAIVYIGKQRNGPTGKVKLIWDGRYQRFDNDNRMYTA